MPDEDQITEKTPLLHRLFGTPSKTIAEPEKELRFTRARQATLFFFLTAVCLMLAIGSLFAAFLNLGWTDYYFQKNWWLALLPLIPAFIFLRTALHCIRHAYIILTPMGIEIFPFFKPQKNLQVIFWSELHSTETKDENLILHNNPEKTSGTIITLKPLTENQIPLLKKAITARLKEPPKPNHQSPTTNSPNP